MEITPGSVNSKPSVRNPSSINYKKATLMNTIIDSNTGEIICTIPVTS